MFRGAKQNWFQSPHAKKGIWLFHDDKIDLFNSSKQTTQQRFSFLTPSHPPRPIQLQKNIRSYHNNTHQAQNSKFQDINLPDMFSNTLIQRQVINEKINFQQSSLNSEQNGFQTPSRHQDNTKNVDDKFNKQVPRTAVKQGHSHPVQQKRPRPKQKGLRMLSQKAYEIVTKMNGATYKEVANKLVDQLAVQDTVEINGKDQQNIKRRVYDALNVLIALGILKKDGRKIHGLKNKNASEEAKHQEIKKMMGEIQLKKYRMIQKNKQFKNTKIKAQMIKALIKRNSLFPAKHNRIEFPYIAISVEQKCENNISFKNDRIQILSSQKSIEPYGDIDTIQFMKPLLRAFIE